MSGDSLAPSLLPLAEERSVIASEAKQPRSRNENAGALAPFRSWVASPSARNDVIEWSVAAAFVLVAVLVSNRPYDEIVPLATFALAALVAWIVAQDLRSFTIADGAVVALAASALAIRHAAGDPLLALGLDVVLTGGVLLAFREIYFRRRGFDGLGLGDVKLAAAGGLLVGAQAFAWALLGASLAALGVVAAMYLVARRRGHPIAPAAGYKLAFGAFLAPALYAVWIAQAWPIVLPIVWGA